MHIRINALVPELECLDLEASLAFYTDILGFKVVFARPENRFAYLALDDAQIMLKQANGYWQTGPLEPPLGRGINFQITVAQTAPILDRLEAASMSLFADPETSWYRTGDVEHGQNEFLVQDPDGYLLRICQALGKRSPNTK